MMNIYCVSDLHLCDKGPRDNFAFEGRETRFHSFLNAVEAEHAELVILGDLFDWWQTNLSRSVVIYRELLDRLADLKAVWVIGNHDGDLVHFLGTDLMPAHPFFARATSPFIRDVGGRKILFMHGHEGDPYCNDTNPGIGEITAIISALLEDRNKTPFQLSHAVEDTFVGTLENALTLWRRLTFQASRFDEMLGGVENYRIKRGADVVVCGHTHQAGRIGHHHYNAGSWCRTNDTYIRITESGSCHVFEWPKGCQPLDCDALELQ